MITTPALLRHVMPRLSAAGAELWAPILRETFVAFSIDTPLRIAMFLAQAAHESAELRRLEENLNYGAEGLVKTWPTRFTLESAAAYARQPERIANRVYADRMGNGNEASGDGWRNRGRGIFGLTGAENYRAASLALFKLGLLPSAEELVLRPERAAEPAVAAPIAGWFWNSRKLSPIADAGDFVAVTRKINGGIIGLSDRIGYYDRARRFLHLT